MFTARHITKVCKLSLLSGALLLATTPSWADIVSGEVWENAGNAGNAADFAGNTTGDHANFTSSGIDYCSQPSGIGPGCSATSAYNVAAFLNFPTFTGATGGFLPNKDLNNTFIQLTGTIFLTAGANSFNINHDDGLVLSLDGGIGTVLNDGGATSPTVTPFTITAPSTGNFHFTLDYAECCGAPAVLQWTFPSGTPVGSVPEPSSAAVLVGTLATMAFFLRRRKRA
jgi:hypothetical protein